MTNFGFLVSRRGMPAEIEWKPGQSAETYELLAPLPTTEAVPFDPARRLNAAHDEARRIAPTIRGMLRSKEFRRLRVLTCTCPKSTALVTLCVGPDGRKWALITQRESIPPAFRREDDDRQPKAWPLHREPTGSPHIELSTCPRCRRVWCVALTESSAELIPTRPTYGAVIAP